MRSCQRPWRSGRTTNIDKQIFECCKYHSHQTYHQCLFCNILSYWRNSLEKVLFLCSRVSSCNIFATKDRTCFTKLLRRLGTLSKWGRQRREARKIFLPNPRVLLSISLLWLPCMFLFSLKFRWLQRLFLNERLDVSSWNVGHVLKTAWKWSSWSLIWEQDGTNVSFISHIHVRFLSCVY